MACAASPVPAAAEADRRLEGDSGLRHQPLAVLADRPAAGGDALWAAHVARARAQLDRLRLRAPRPKLAAADPRALRALVLVGLATSVGIAGPDAASRLAAAFHPGFVAAPPPPAPMVQAWITPPAYTGVPPIFLKGDTSRAGESVVTVPADSKMTVSVTGGSPDAPPTLDQPGHSDALTALDPTSFQIEQTLATGGRIVVRRHGRDMAGWDVAVVPDTAPVVRFPEPPGIQRNGVNPQTRLPWEASHAYGVASLQAELHLIARPDAPALILPIPLPGNAPKTAHGVRVQDLTANVWAGLPVTAQLVARDAPGLEGRSETLIFTLPERRFVNAVARAVAAVRRELSHDPTKRDAAIAELGRIGRLDTVWDDDVGGYLNLRAIGSLLGMGRDPTTVAQAQERLWSLALHLEEGAPDRTARALETARQELRDQLEADKNGDKKADPTELDRKIQALQEALQKRLDALSEQARRDPDTDAYNPDEHPLDQREMQKLTEEMRDSAKKSETDKTRDKMAQLDRLMDQLKNGRPEHGQMTEAEKQRAEKRAQGQQQMSALQDMVQREGTLLDTEQGRANTAQSFRRPPPSPDAANARTADQRTQLALRRAVGELMSQAGDLTGDVPPALGDADTAMREGAQAIADSRDAQAAQAAQRAIEALQKGGQQMAQALAQKFGRGQPGGDQAGDGDDGDGGRRCPAWPRARVRGQGDGQGDGDGTGPGRGRRFGSRPGDGPDNGRPGPNRQHARRPGQNLDPFGRPRGEGVAGSDAAGEVEVPEKMEEARTRELQEELRRRGADRSRSQEELDYIDRLLKQF